VLDDKYLNEIRARADAVTAGPWRAQVEGRDHTSGSSFIQTGSGAGRGADIELSGATPADYDFIAHARQDLPLLLDEVIQMRNDHVYAQSDVTLLDRTGNAAVALLRGRKFPGVLIQGDSLKILLDDVREAGEALMRQDVQSAKAQLAAVAERLADLLGVFEAASARAGFDLPYTRTPPGGLG